LCRLQASQSDHQKGHFPFAQSGRPPGPARSIKILLYPISCQWLLANQSGTSVTGENSICHTHGLFQFRVTPFGLTNAPAVFQRLMQRVLMGLNPLEGRQFVSVYIDDVLVFSETLLGHMEHLKLVIQRIEQVGLKLKPSKCHFMCDEVEYLGHVLTPKPIQSWSQLSLIFHSLLTSLLCDNFISKLVNKFC